MPARDSEQFIREVSGAGPATVPEKEEKRPRPEAKWSPEAEARGEELAIKINQLYQWKEAFENEGKLKEAKELHEQIAALVEEMGGIREKEEKSSIITAQTPEGREISFNLREQLKYWGDFYKENNLDWVSLPETISLAPDQIKEMIKLMEQGFDKLIIIPDDLVTEPTITVDPSGKPTAISNPRYEKLHRLMRQGYSQTMTGGHYDDEGRFQGAKDKTTKLRLILTKDVQNLADDPLFKATLNKSIEDLEKDEMTRFTGFSESSYLIYQREYFKRTGKHLDEAYWTWFPESDRPLSGCVSRATWDRGNGGRLVFNSDARDDRGDGYFGCRLAGSFEINIRPACR